MPATVAPPARAASRPNIKPAAGRKPQFGQYQPPKSGQGKPPEVLYQKYFKSAGTRTYAVQVSRARNDNQFITLIEGRRDPETNEVRKTKLLVFSEDYVEFFRMMHDLAVWVREHPLPEEFRDKRRQYWAKKKSQQPPAVGAPSGKSSGPMKAAESEENADCA